MVRFRSGKSIRGALNYNERKVLEGKAVLLEAVSYHKASSELTFTEKLKRLQRLADLRPRVAHKCVHISLNFSPDDMLSDRSMREIAGDYMNRIGFGNQPYLIYMHNDTAHPHLHIVSTPIDCKGGRIDLHHLVERLSEPARTHIEESFGLIRASERELTEEYLVPPVLPEVALYGVKETKAAISSVVRAVVEYYKYTSLNQLNIVLQQFNVRAYRGDEGSRMFEKGGLTYSIIGPTGTMVGKAIKASSIYGKPTLSNLQKRFERNKNAYRDLSRVKLVIDKAIGAKKIDSSKFITQLKKAGIYAAFSFNRDGELFGVTYVDNLTKSVIKGSELGKGYSAAGLKSSVDIKTLSAYESWNETFSKSVLEQTDFSKGIKEVVTRWAGTGLSIIGTSNEDGSLAYRAGHIASPLNTYVDLDNDMCNYFAANGCTPYFFSVFNNHIGASPGEVPTRLFQSTLTSLNVVMNSLPIETLDRIFQIFDASLNSSKSTGSYVSAELIKEAKRKRRKRHQ